MNEKKHEDDAEPPKIIKHIIWLFRNWRAHPIPIFLAGVIALSPIVWQFKDDIRGFMYPEPPVLALSIAGFQIGETRIDDFREERNISSSRVKGAELPSSIYGEENQFQQIDGKTPVEGFPRSVDYSARFQGGIIRSLKLQFDCNTREDGGCWQYCSAFVPYVSGWYLDATGQPIDNLDEFYPPLDRLDGEKSEKIDERYDYRHFNTRLSYISRNKHKGIRVNLERWYWGEYSERWERSDRFSSWKFRWRRPEKKENSYYYCRSLVEIHYPKYPEK